MTYTIVEGHSRGELIKNVNAAMAEGWRPCGSITMVARDGEHCFGSSALYWQPMVRD